MLTTSQAALEVSSKEEQGVLEVSHKENQDLRIGVWMEYFPDWLVGLGRDGISRLLGFLIDGAAVGNLPVKWELWGPTWAYDHLNQFLNELDPKSSRCCRVHRSDRSNPFQQANFNLQKMLTLPIQDLDPEVASQVDFALRVTHGNASPYANGAYERNCLREFVLLAAEANRKSSVDCWYVPSPRFRHAVLLAGPKLAAFPDMVLADFPRFYVNKPEQDHTNGFWSFEHGAKRLLTACDAVVSYSEDVRTRHVVGRLGIEPSKTHVIHHGRITFEQSSGEGMRAEARRKIMQFLSQKHIDEKDSYPDYIDKLRNRSLDFNELKFAFISSALRPYKNIANAVRAISQLRRELGSPIKLVTTARIDWAGPDIGDVRRAIEDEGAFFDVISIPEVPPDILQALYCAADVSLAISLFEGGAPFIITESLSAGTPVIVADRPYVREVLPEADRAGLINPHDLSAISTAIRHAIENRSALVDQQRVIFGALLDRSWTDTVGDYLDVMRSLAATSSPDLSHSAPASVPHA